MNKITSFIATLGTNPIWIAANAHFWFAAFLMHVTHNFYLLAAIVVAAAIKEFWFDAKYETDPVQTNFDNWTDFAGYVGGAAFGYFM